jgi:hypothetical protein
VVDGDPFEFEKLSDRIRAVASFFAPVAAAMLAALARHRERACEVLPADRHLAPDLAPV